MRIQLGLLQIARDTLYGSLRVADRGEIWQYTREGREMALREIQILLDSIELDLQITEPEPTSLIEVGAGK